MQASEDCQLLAIDVDEACNNSSPGIQKLENAFLLLRHQKTMPNTAGQIVPPCASVCSKESRVANVYDV